MVHVTSAQSLNTLDRAQDRSVGEMEGGNFQGRGAQATPTPRLREVIMEAGGTGGSSHLPRPSRTTTQGPDVT